MRPLHQRGAKETKKQRLRRALKLQRAGLTDFEGAQELMQPRRVRGVGADGSGSDSSSSEAASLEEEDGDEQANGAAAANGLQQQQQHGSGSVSEGRDAEEEEEEGRPAKKAKVSAGAVGQQQQAAVQEQQQDPAAAAAAQKAQVAALRAEARALKAQARAEAAAEGAGASAALGFKQTSWVMVIAKQAVLCRRAGRVALCPARQKLTSQQCNSRWILRALPKRRYAWHVVACVPLCNILVLLLIRMACPNPALMCWLPLPTFPPKCVGTLLASPAAVMLRMLSGAGASCF
mgnify:FL=1